MLKAETVRAFTRTYDHISNRLISLSDVYHGDLIYHARTLWDTGATISCISHGVVESLGLISSGFASISTPSGDKEVATYLVGVELPNDVRVDWIEVCETEIGKQDIDLLVGMDIINRGDLSVSNYGGKTVFSFVLPSMKTTDYVKQIDVMNKIGPKHGRKKK